MSCFFCESTEHVSHNCDIHVTNKARWDFLATKNCCRMCLTTFEGNGNFQICENCQRNQKCYICFSRGHHTVYCLERFTESQIFPPNINHDLFSRFLKILTFEEKCILLFSFPIFLELINPKPLKIAQYYDYHFSGVASIMDSDVVVANKFSIDNTKIQLPKTSITLPTKSIGISSLNSMVIFHFRHLNIQRSSFNSNEFLQLLSPKTKMVRCGIVKFYPELSFPEILEKGPNLVDVEIHQTNIVSTDSWPNDLLRLDSKLKCLTLSIPEFHFDVESLAKYMMKRKAADIYLYIKTLQSGPFYKNETFKMVTEKLSNYFVPDESFLSCQNLTVTFERKNNNSESKRFQLKNV